MTEASAKPAPRQTADSTEFWGFAADGQLMLRQCKACSNIFYYPRITCTHCLSTDLGWSAASGRGTIHAFTLIHRAPNDAFRGSVPYPVAIIELEEGPRPMSNIVECANDAITIGTAVELVFEPRGDTAVPQFRPSQGATS